MISKNTKRRQPKYDPDGRIAEKQKEAIQKDEGLRHRIVRSQNGNGKGDTYRLVDTKKFGQNYDQIRWKSKKGLKLQ